MKTMLNLIFAPSADMLLPLAGKIIRQAWTDPFDPPTIIVPNPAVGKWLKIRLTESPLFGCVANARMTTLEKFLWKSLGGKNSADMITADHLSQVICAVLNDDVLNNEIYAPLKNYLYRTDGRINALKRVQLSMKIASQFLEYEYNRPSVWDNEKNNWRSHGIDAKWIMGEPYYGGTGHEAWQADLYRRVNEYFSDNTRMSLPHLYRKTREMHAKKNDGWCNVGTNRRIILFGVSKISHFHRNTLVEISQIDDVDMHVFLTNPCAEFWEDVNTSRLRRKWQNDSPDDLAGIKPVKPDDYNKSELSEIGMFANKRDHALLEQWGEAGKENIFLWCPQADWNFEYIGGDTEQTASTETLLGALQKSLLRRENNLNIVDDKLRNDGSIQILACPDTSREIEELRELILDMAHEGRIKSFNDVAVYMPDTNKYLPHIQRVFGAYSHNHPEYIPFAILGASCGSSLTAQALLALLDIISGQFNRARIFELLRNPIVQSSREISPDNVEIWEKWAEEFGMFRGYDKTLRRSMGDMGEAVTDEHTFKRGMEKVIAQLHDNLDVSVLCGATSDRYLNKTLTSIDMNPLEAHELAETFMFLLKELNELASSFIKIDSGGTIHIKKSVENLQKAVWFWIGDIPNDSLVNYSVEERVRSETLDGFKRILLQYELTHREQMPADEFTALARGCVPEEVAVPASAWNGVTFAPLRASMVLPHRAVFALGLGASDFPGVSESGSWKLLTDRRNVNGKMKSNRIIGDSDRVRDNRFAFLELIHAAKEQLILSYRARDMQKDEELQPSSVIMELTEYLIGQGLTDGKDDSRRCSIRREIPWVVYESLDRAVERGRRHGTWNRTQRELSILTAAATKDRVRHRHELAISVKSVPTQNADLNQRSVDMRDLKLFFKNPLEYHLSKTLGIRNYDDDIDIYEINEPLMSDKRSLTRLKERVWITILKAVFPPDTNPVAPISDSGKLAKLAACEAAKIYDGYTDSGHAPEGHVSRAEKNSLLRWATLCVEPALKLSGHFPNHQLAEKLDFSIECDDFILSGQHALTLIPKISEDKSLNIGQISFGDKKTDPLENRNSWLDCATLWLCENKDGGAHSVIPILLICGDKPVEKRYRVTPDIVKYAEMKKWLTGMLSQMLNEKCCEHLPFNVISALVKPTKKICFEERLQELTFAALTDKMPNCSSDKYAKGGLHLTDARTTKMSDEKLRETVYSRYAPMLGRWIHG